MDDVPGPDSIPALKAALQVKEAAYVELLVRNEQLTIQNVKAAADIARYEKLLSKSSALSERDKLLPEKEPEYFLEKVTAIVPNVIYVFNQKTMSNEYCNKEIATTIGYNEAEVQEFGANLFPELCHPDDLPVVYGHLARLAQLETDDVLSIEYRMRHKNGSYRWLLSTDTIFERDAFGTVIKQIGVATDITPMKLVQETLSRSNEELSQFNHLVTHDLKTPVTNIASMILLLREDEKLMASESGEVIGMLEKSLEQAENILNNLLKITKMSQEDAIMKDQCSFPEILEAILDEFKFMISSANASVSFDFSEVESIIYSREHLKSFLRNLLSNALKYRTPNRPLNIHCSTSQEESHIRLSISDTGSGIDLKKDAHKVFGLFKRAHAGGEGNGMGLFMIKKMLERYQGNIEVESTPGKGSIFHLFLNTKNQEVEA